MHELKLKLIQLPVTSIGTLKVALRSRTVDLVRSIALLGDAAMETEQQPAMSMEKQVSRSKRD